MKKKSQSAFSILINHRVSLLKKKKQTQTKQNYPQIHQASKMFSSVLGRGARLEICWIHYNLNI